MELAVEDNLQIIKSFSQEMYRDLVTFWGEKEFSSYIKNKLDAMQRKENFVLASALITLEKEHSSLFS